MLIYKTGDGLVLNPKKFVPVAMELASCNASNDLPTFGLATRQYNPLDFIRLSTMKSFFVEFFLISLIVFI